MMYLEILLIAVAIFGYEFVWVWWYKFKSRRENCSLPLIQSFHPFGLYPVVKLYEASLEKKLMNALDVALGMNGVKTMLSQQLFEYQIVTSDSENYKSVYSVNFKDYTLGLRTNQLGWLFGGGIFTRDGEQWKHSRTILRPLFSREQLKRLTSVTAHARTLISRIKSDEGCMDLQPLYHQLTMDTATEFLFGESVDSLSGREFTVYSPTGEAVTSSQFVDSYKKTIQFGMNRVLARKFYRLIRLKNKELYRDRARIFMDYYVDKALAKGPDEEDNGDGFVLSNELAKLTRDKASIRREMFDILIAGIDTTASTLTLCTYWLARYPEVWRKLRHEIIETFASPEDITYEKVRASRYLNAVINEVLRVSPVVPMNSRTAARDTTLPRGGGKDESHPIFVPKGTTVIFSVYSMHRDKDIWGPDADEFVPERWIGKQIPPWTYVPFSGGPRICLGQQFALTEVSVVLVNLALAFEHLDRGPDFPLEPLYDFALTIHLAKPAAVVNFH